MMHHRHKSLLCSYTPIPPHGHSHLDGDMTSWDLPPVGPKSPPPSRVWALTMPSVILAFKGVLYCVALSTSQPNHLVVHGSHGYLQQHGGKNLHYPLSTDG